MSMGMITMAMGRMTNMDMTTTRVMTMMSMGTTTTPRI